MSRLVHVHWTTEVQWSAVIVVPDDVDPEQLLHSDSDVLVDLEEPDGRDARGYGAFDGLTREVEEIETDYRPSPEEAALLRGRGVHV